MRPLRLDLEGFSTFKDRIEIDFGDVDLIAFVGPTGSGKSSIIDAMTFALFGSVARYDDVRLVAPVITQGANEAKVRLDFELGGRIYTAIRVVRRTKTGATTKEARLELGGDLKLDESPVLASGAKELTAAVEELLGLDFSQFTRTVVLPQGEFAEFLKDDPASRQKLLRRLLDLEIYSRMGVMARERAKDAATRSDALTQQLERHRDVTPEALAIARTNLVALDTFSEQAASVLDEVDEIEGELVTLRQQVEMLDSQLEALSGSDVPNSVADLGGFVAEVAAQAKAAREDRDQLRVRRDALQLEVADLPDTRTIRAQQKEWARTSDLRRTVAELEPALRMAVEEAERADGIVVEAEEAREQADGTLAGIRALADASAWVASLVVGEPCPVCRVEVAAIPDHDPSAELAKADELARSAAATLTTARKVATDQAGEVAARRRRLVDQTEELAELERRLADVRSVDELSELLVKAESAAERATTLTEESRAAERRLDELEAEGRRLADLEREQRSAFGQKRDAVSALEPPAPQGVALLEDWQAFGRWASEQVEQLGATRSEIAIRGKELAAGKAERLGELARGAEAFNLDSSALRTGLVQARVEVTTNLTRLEERLAEADSLRSQVADLQERHQVNDLLGKQLGVSGFERWLLAEALEDLVERATVRLKELSNGQFSLTTTENTFRIIDHRNADHDRDVRTLSGGETFLASLALALALSDSIADLAPVDSPRLESMFLDEGFGTLDPETLDVVAGAIEELSASGRLVGIVTHIEALAERMPVRFVVTKGPSTSSVERQMS